MSEGGSANGGGNDKKAGFAFSDFTYQRRKRRLDSTNEQIDAEHVNTTGNAIVEKEGQSRIQSHWKKILHQLSLSQDGNDDVIKSCIQKAHLAGDSSWSKKACSLPISEQTKNDGTLSKITRTVNGTICDGSNKALSLPIISSNNEDSRDHVNDNAVSKVWENVLVEILASEKFALLCDLLVGKLPGIRPDSILNFSAISSKLKNREYGLSFGLLHQDLELIWETIHKIGQELGLLATNLSNISQTSFEKQMGKHTGVAIDVRDIKIRWGIDTEVKNSMNPQTNSPSPHESNPATDLNQREVYCPHRDSITADDGRKLHQDCEACQRLKLSGMLLEASADEGEEDQKEGLQEDSVSNMGSDECPELERTKREHLCKLCEKPEDSGMRFITCDHSFCNYKYYHIQCLKSHQVARQDHKHGGWYCPSCLCRECLVDKDDEKIVMCDGCDEGYHIYCLKPPLSSIPKGKWFCVSCNIQRIKMEVRRYEQSVLQQLGQSEGRLDDGSNRPMELLISAADKVEELDSVKKIGH